MWTKKQRSRARAMRHAPTRSEAKVWRWLRGRRFLRYKFRRQHPFGPYILDFYCYELRLAIELDGAGHLSPDRQEYDSNRGKFLARSGITVLRIMNNDLREGEEFVADRIQAAIDALTRRFAPPSPTSGRGI